MFPVKELFDELRLVDYTFAFIENDSFRGLRVCVRATITFAPTPVLLEELRANGRFFSRRCRVENVNVGSVAVRCRAVQKLRTNPKILKRNDNIDAKEVSTVRYTCWHRWT